MNPLVNNAIFLIGPTASGKTAIAHIIYENFKISLISMDSMQIYKGMDIGTSKPSKNEIKKYKYYGIDIVDPDFYFSTGDYLRYCEKILKEIYKKGNTPLFVGGTGLYFNSLTRGFDDIPKANKIVREKIEKKIKKYGIEYVYNELYKIDKNYATKISKTDKKRIIRALEVFYLTSKPFSSFHKKKLFIFDKKSSDTEDFTKHNNITIEKYNIKNNITKNHIGLKNQNKYNKILKIGLYIPRPVLYERINKRVEQMIADGFIEEAFYLYLKYKDKDFPSLKAIGYSHFFNFFRSNNIYKISNLKNKTIKDSLNKVIELIKRDTRRYAKRQYTWFKRDSEIIWINLYENNNNINNNINKSIDKILKMVKTYIDGKI